MQRTLQSLDLMIEPLRKLATFVGQPLLLLSIRLFMAWTFFKSGMIKFGTWQDGNFDSTIYLFEEIHPVPGLDPTFAAYAATGAEVILPVLLAVGLFSRFSAAGLLVMTMTIQYLIGGDFYLNEHNYWILLLAVPFIVGPGRLSVDALLRYVIWNGKKEAHGSRSDQTSEQNMQGAVLA